MGSKIETMDVGVLAEQVKQTHGSQALNYATTTAKQHLRTAAWKSGALWLQVVNRLNISEMSSQSGVNRPS